MATFNEMSYPLFAPVSSVTPFTYRDGETFLNQLHRLRDYVREMMVILEKADEDNRDYVNAAIQSLISQFNDGIADLQSQINNLSDGALAFNPTNGRKEALSKVVNDTYDNTRVFAYFAKELDDLALTAVQYDTLVVNGARHFDTGITYPTIHDYLGEN